MSNELAVGSGYDSYQRYFDHEANPPALVLEWKDKELGAEGYLAIYSLRGGAAGGGTRMARYATSADARNEAISLAKTMEIKFKVAGPEIGGGKSVINFDPASPQRKEVLLRWFRAIRPFLSACYGTGGDVAVSDDEVIDYINKVDREFEQQHASMDETALDLALLRDPQAGIVRGHYSTGIDVRIGNLRKGVPMVVPEMVIRGEHPEVSHLVTGLGVACAVRKAILCRGDQLEGTRVLIEGFGNVGSAAALFLDQWGADVVGVLTLAPVSGMNGSRKPVRAKGSGGKLDVAGLLERSTDATLSADDVESIASDADFFGISADVFVPAAISHTITPERLQLMREAGVHTIVPGANVPFAKTSGDNGQALSRQADRDFSIVPDFIANCGMARAFAFFMSQSEPISDQGLWERLSEDINDTIESAIEKVWVGPDGRGMLNKAYEEYLEPVRDTR